MQLLNLELMAHPFNWLTVFLMCLLALLLLIQLSPTEPPAAPG